MPEELVAVQMIVDMRCERLLDDIENRTERTEEGERRGWHRVTTYSLHGFDGALVTEITFYCTALAKTKTNTVLSHF